MYTAHRGWAAPAGTPAFLAYRLKKTTPLAAAVGAAVHSAAVTCVSSLVTGARLPTYTALRAAAAATLNALWRSSRDRRQAFWRWPNDVPMLQEVLYRTGPGPDALRRARAKLERCLANLLDCDELWRLVVEAAPGDVVLMDRFYSFMVPDEILAGGVRCYAAADLLVRPGPGTPWIVVDFKSGAHDGVVDQILTYALAARDGLGLDLDSAGCEGLVIALNEAPPRRVARFSIASGEIDGAAARIRESIAAMRALLVDPRANVPASIETFAPASDARICGSCAYRALCYPELHPT